MNVFLNPISRRPAVPLAISLAIGISIHSLFPIYSTKLLIAATLVTTAAAFFIQKKILANTALCISLILLGITLAQREHFYYPANDIGQFAGDDSHLATLELRVLEEPQIIAPSFGQVRPLPPRQMISTRVLRIKTWQGWIDGSGELPVTIDQPNPQLAAGQTIRVLGMLQRPLPAMNPGEFDWATYYREQRILAMLSINKSGNIQILNTGGFAPITWLRLKTRHLLAAGFTNAHGTDHAVLQAILLGDRDAQMRDVQDEFKNIGAAYQLSVSGLHIAILAGVVFWICRLLLLRPQNTVCVVIAFVLLYAVVALPSHSGARSVVLCVSVALATLTHRPTDRFQLLATAVFFLLPWHSLDLLSAGFQLSFAAVVGLAIYLPKLREFLLALRDPDLVALDQPIDRPPLHRGLTKIVAYLLRSLQFSGIAWLATLPLVAFHFGELSPYAIIAGTILLPLVCVALFAGLLKIIVTLLWPSIATPAAIIAGSPIVLIRHIVHALSKLPFGTVLLPVPPVWLIVLYYVLLVIPFVVPPTILLGRRRLLLRVAPIVAVLLVLILPLYPRLAKPTADPFTLKVTLLSLGAGQCAIVEPPSGSPILLDAGSSTVADLTRKVIAPFLHQENQNRIAEIFLSHGDYDHISAAAELAAAYNVHDIFISPHFRKNAENNPPDQALLQSLDQLDLTPRLLAIGDHQDIGNGAAIDILWPPAVADLNSNNAGIVLKLTYAGKTILFPADIQDPGIEGVLKNPSALKADILVAAHHGSSESLTPTFLKAVDPAIILSSNAAKLTNKQKRFDLMVGSTPIYRTSKYGAITVKITQQGKISIETFVQKP